jgi:hypothetical protein
VDGRVIDSSPVNAVLIALAGHCEHRKRETLDRNMYLLVVVLVVVWMVEIRD